MPLQRGYLKIMFDGQSFKMTTTVLEGLKYNKISNQAIQDSRSHTIAD